MTIVKCPKCGKMIHKAEMCPYCGNSAGFESVDEKVEVHENVAVEYAELPSLLADGKFVELIEKSRVVLQWMPKCSSVFWMRLLAKNECKTDAEIIEKGLNCDDASDFYNAVRYGSQVERATYESVKNLIESIRTAFETVIAKHEYEEKAATPIVRCQVEFASELKERRKELFDLWSQLEKTEQEMYVIEQDCKLLANEYRIALESSRNEANQIKAQSYKLNECTAEELHKYLVRLENVLSLSDASKKELDLMRKQLPCVENFNSKVQESEKIRKQISLKLSELKSFENRIHSTVSEIECIEKRHLLALRALADYDFRSAYSLLGARRFEEVMRNVGFISFASNISVAQGSFHN